MKLVRLNFKTNKVTIEEIGMPGKTSIRRQKNGEIAFNLCTDSLCYSLTLNEADENKLKQLLDKN